MRQVVLDTETTGLSPESGDRLIEIGCVVIVDRRLTGEQFHAYVNPEGRRSHADALAIHGITDEFLQGQRPFAAIADELLALLEGAELIIHNAAFDVGFVNAELRRIGKPPLADVVGRITDTVALAREQYPGKSISLDALCKRLEVDNTHRTLHGALLDAELLAEVYIRMTRGQHTLAMDAEGPSGRDADAGGADAPVAIDLSALELIVLTPTPDERAAHEALLALVAKDSGGRLLWPQAVAE